MASQPVKTRGCEFCRVRHYKCDDGFPACQRCQQTGRKCIRRRSIRFHPERSRWETFPHGQNWVRYPKRVDFVDETDYLIQGVEWEAEEDIDNSVVGSPNRDKLRGESSNGESPTLHHEPSLTEVTRSPLSVAAASQLSTTPLTTTKSPGFPSRHSLPSPSSRHDISPERGPTEVLWPLPDLQEAILLHHFVTDVSRFFDFCDRERHFAIEVPQRARSCRTLYNAILALSARHLSQIKGFDAYASTQYYQECLRTLIPSLSDPKAALDDNLLAATVILRLFEEFDVPDVGYDLQGHLVGTQSFLQACDFDPMESGLRQAAYWAGVRQDIYISLALQRAPNIKPSARRFPFEEPLLSPANDCTWACRTVLHCAAVLDFAFGSHDHPHSLLLYQRLEGYNRQWRTSRPASFDPYFSQPANDQSFPDLRFHTDWHVMGYQYLELAHILLMVYDPAIPRLGPAHRSAMQLLDKNVRNVTRVLCGIGLSNPSTPSAILITCMAINLCGDRFVNTHEREELLSILVETERHLGWPTKKIQQSLNTIWGNGSERH